MESSRGQEISVLNWKWGYVIILCKFVTNMGFGIIKAFGVLLPLMVERFNTNYATLGFLCTLPGSIMLFSGPFVSLVLQRVDHRLVAMLGGVISAVCLVSCGFISNITGLGITLALTGALLDVIQSYTIVFMMIGIPVLFFTINVVVISVLLKRRLKSKHV